MSDVAECAEGADAKIVAIKDATVGVTAFA